MNWKQFLKPTLPKIGWFLLVYLLYIFPDLVCEADAPCGFSGVLLTFFLVQSFGLGLMSLIFGNVLSILSIGAFAIAKITQPFWILHFLPKTVFCNDSQRSRRRRKDRWLRLLRHTLQCHHAQFQSPHWNDLTFCILDALEELPMAARCHQLSRNANPAGRAQILRGRGWHPVQPDDGGIAHGDHSSAHRVYSGGKALG